MLITKARSSRKKSELSEIKLKTDFDGFDFFRVNIRIRDASSPAVSSSLCGSATGATIDRSSGSGSGSQHVRGVESLSRTSTGGPNALLSKNDPVSRRQLQLYNQIYGSCGDEEEDDVEIMDLDDDVDVNDDN